MARLTATVRREINRIRKDIAQKSSELQSLSGELQRHERVYRLLAAESGRRPRVRARRGRLVDWSDVLKGLPSSFTIDDIARRPAVRTKPRAYLRQVVVRWAKQRKIKRAGRGKYLKT